MFQSIRTYRRTGDDFSATAPCTYVRFTFLKRRYMKNSDYIFGHEIKPSEIRKLFACWQKWFYGIELLRTAKLMCGNMGNHTV